MDDELVDQLCREVERQRELLDIILPGYLHLQDTIEGLEKEIGMLWWKMGEAKDLKDFNNNWFDVLNEQYHYLRQKMEGVDEDREGGREGTIESEIAMDEVPENVVPVYEGLEDWEEIIEVPATHVLVTHGPVTQVPVTWMPTIQEQATQVPVDLVLVDAWLVVDEANVPVNKPEEQETEPVLLSDMVLFLLVLLLLQSLYNPQPHKYRRKMHQLCQPPFSKFPPVLLALNNLQLPATNSQNPGQGLPLFLYLNHGDLLAFTPNHPHPHLRHDRGMKRVWQGYGHIFKMLLLTT